MSLRPVLVVGGLKSTNPLLSCVSCSWMCIPSFRVVVRGFRSTCICHSYGKVLKSIQKLLLSINWAHTRSLARKSARFSRKHQPPSACNPIVFDHGPETYFQIFSGPWVESVYPRATAGSTLYKLWGSPASKSSNAAFEIRLRLFLVRISMFLEQQNGWGGYIGLHLEELYKIRGYPFTDRYIRQKSGKQKQTRNRND